MLNWDHTKITKYKLKGWLSLLTCLVLWCIRNICFMALNLKPKNTSLYLRSATRERCISLLLQRKRWATAAERIKINWIICLTVSWKRGRKTATEREREMGKVGERQGSRICVDFHSGGRYLVFSCGPCHIYCIKVRVFICSKSAFSLSPLLHVINAEAMSLSDLGGLQAWLTVMAA